jgi:predicted nucleotidyltransferase
MIFESAHDYILNVDDQLTRIARIGQIIAGLENMMIIAASTGNFDEYSLDDGQTKIRTKYRDAAAIAKSLADFDALQQRLLARLNNNKNGRVTRFMDSKNFPR